MLMEELDTRRFELCSLVAGGRRAADELSAPGYARGPIGLAVSFDSIGGAGVALELDVDGRPLTLWVDDASWCEWLRPVLPVHSVADIAPELTAVLAAWTIEPLHAYCELHGLGHLRVDGLRPLTLEAGPDVILHLSGLGGVLACRIVAAPHEFVRALAAPMQPVHTQPTVADIMMPLCAGWVRMRLDALQELPSGAALVLDVAADVGAGQGYLYHERALALLEVLPDSGMLVLATDEIDNGDATRVTSPVAAQEGSAAVKGSRNMELEVSVTVIAEIARVSMPLEDLRELRPGSVIATTMEANGGVTLTVNGHAIGTGQLLRLGDKLAVRVD